MMSRSFPCPSSLSTEVVVVVGQKSYACLPGEGARAAKGLTGRWADALLRNPAQGTVSTVSGMDLDSQLTHQSLLQCSSRTPCAGTGAACVPPRQRQRSAGNGCLHCAGNEGRNDSSAIGVVPPRATAVGIHPPLSRGSLRAARSAVQAPTTTPSVCASAESSTQTRDIEFDPAKLTPSLLADQAPPSPPPAVGTGPIISEADSLAVWNGPGDSARPLCEPSAGVMDQRPTRVKAPVDVHLQSFPMSSSFHRGGGNIHGNWSVDGGCGGPLASAATPHSFSVNHAPSSMFQSLAEATPTTHSSSDVPYATLSHPSVTARGKEGNSPLQRQHVTPMTRACDARAGIPPTSLSGELLPSEGGAGQFSYNSELATHNDGEGGMLGFLSPSAATAPSHESLLPSARSTFAVVETSPCVQSALPSAARDLPQQQRALYFGECSMNQDTHSKLHFHSPSSCETAQLSGTPGGLSTSRSATAYSTAPRRGHSAVTVGTGQRISMGSAAPLASPGSLSPNFSGVYTSPPTSAQQASLSSRASRFSSLPASGSKKQRSQARIVAGDTPSVRVHVLHQEHPSHAANGIDGVRRNGAHDSALPPSSRSSGGSPQSTFTDGQASCFGEVARATMAAAREQPGSVFATSTTAPVAGAGPTSVMPRVASDNPTALSLDNQLLCGSKGELAQMLLVLARCNPEASCFIRSKAFLFSFRNEQSDEVAGARNIYSAGAPTMTAFDAAAASHASGGPHKRRGESSSGVASESVNMPGCDCPGERPVVLQQPVAVAASLGTAAATHGPVIARCIFPVGVADEEDGDGNGCVAEHRAPDRIVTKGAVKVKVSQRHTCPEDRTFSSELHPCFYWYGACRNTTSCMFVSLPRNICLNWIRGSCMAGAECSGVHRLPSPCSPQVCDIYKLNHGLLRRDAHTAPRVHRHSGLSFSRECTSQTQVRLASGSLGVEITARRETGVFHAAAAKRCAGRVVGGGLSAGVSEGSSVDQVEVHTPTNQGIWKDTFPGDSSRAHGLSKVRQSQSRTSAMSILVRSDHGATMKGDGGGVRDSSDTVTAVEVAGPADQEILKYTGGILGADAGASSASALLLCANAPQRRWKSGMAPPDGSSRCSTAEGSSSCADSTIRCLGPHFDRVATPAPNCGGGHPGSSVTALAEQQLLPGTKSIKSICNVKASSSADPMWSLGDDPLAGTFSDVAGELAYMDNECDFAALSSGTRTRIHSPVCGGE